MNRSLSGSDVEEELIPLAQRLAAARGRDAGSGFAAPSSRSSDSSGRQSCQGQGSPDEDADVSIVRVELACDKVGALFFCNAVSRHYRWEYQWTSTVNKLAELGLCVAGPEEFFHQTRRSQHIFRQPR